MKMNLKTALIIAGILTFLFSAVVKADYSCLSYWYNSNDGTCTGYGGSVTTCETSFWSSTCYYYAPDNTDYKSYCTWCSYGCDPWTAKCNPAPTPTPTPTPSCTNDCSYSGQTSCSGSYKYTCGYYDADSCLDWNSGAYCAYGCSSGSCNPAPTPTPLPSCSGTDTSCGSPGSCVNCNVNDGCSGGYYNNYYCYSNSYGCTYSVSCTEACCDAYYSGNSNAYCSSGTCNPPPTPTPTPTPTPAAICGDGIKSGSEVCDTAGGQNIGWQCSGQRVQYCNSGCSGWNPTLGPCYSTCGSSAGCHNLYPGNACGAGGTCSSSCACILPTATPTPTPTPTPLITCAGNVQLTLSPNPAVADTDSVTPVASGMSNCGGEWVYFKKGSCTGTQVSSCIIQAGFPDYGAGCTGAAFTAPQQYGDVNYYACIDRNVDGDFND